MRSKKNYLKALPTNKRLSSSNVSKNLLSLIPNLQDNGQGSETYWEEEIRSLSKRFGKHDAEKADLVIETVINKLGLTGKEREDVQEFLKFYLDLEELIEKQI